MKWSLLVVWLLWVAGCGNTTVGVVGTPYDAATDSADAREAGPVVYAPPIVVTGEFRSPTPDAPRPRAPLAASNVTTQRPTLRWFLSERWTAADLELCHDRTCTQVEQRVRVTESSWRSETMLRPGPHFWRLWGYDLSGQRSAEPSHVWNFHVPHRDTPVDSVYGTTCDVNGDGLADLLLLLVESRTVVAYLGHPEGTRTVATELWRMDGEGRPDCLISVGDMDGDGAGEIVVCEFATGPTDQGFMGLFGVPRRIRLISFDQRSRVRYSFTVGEQYGPYSQLQARGSLDINEDGYGDVVISGAVAEVDGEEARFPSRNFALLGRSADVGEVSFDSVPQTLRGNHFWANFYEVLGDVNGDGRADIIGVETRNMLNPVLGLEHIWTPALGGAQAVMEFYTPMPQACRQKMVASPRCDLNGDGLADHVTYLMGCGGPDPVYYQYGNRFGAAVYHRVARDRPGTRSNVEASCAGDYDENGTDEIGLYENGDGVLYELVNGQLQQRLRVEGVVWAPVGVGDTVGDGHLSVLLQSAATSGQARVCHGTYDNLMRNCQILRVDPAPPHVWIW